MIRELIRATPLRQAVADVVGLLLLVLVGCAVTVLAGALVGAL